MLSGVNPNFGSDKERVLLVGWSKLCIIFKRGLLYFRFASQGLMCYQVQVIQVSILVQIANECC